MVFPTSRPLLRPPTECLGSFGVRPLPFMSAHRKEVGPEITETLFLQEHTSFLARGIQNSFGAGRSTRDRASDGSARLRTRPPVGEEGEEGAGTHTAVTVERSKKPPAMKAGGVIVVATRRGLVTGRGPRRPAGRGGPVRRTGRPRSPATPTDPERQRRRRR